MALESKYHLDPSVIYRCTFNDNTAVTANPYGSAIKGGNPTFAGGIATFNGTSDYYKLRCRLNLGTKYSIEIRFKLSSVPSGEVTLFGKDSNNKLYITTGNRIYHKSGGTDSYIAWTRDTNWHSLIISRNGSTAAMYLDGVSLSITGAFSATTQLLLNTIGALETPANYFPGQIDYINIWNRVLSASEVQNISVNKSNKMLPYVQGEVLGSELVGDSNFDGSGWWSLDAAGWAISGGVASITNSSGSKGIFKNAAFPSNKLLKHTIVISSLTAGTIRLQVQTSVVRTISSAGTYTIYHVTDLGYPYIYALNGTTATIDSYSVKEVLSSQLNTLFHINCDRGIIQDRLNKITPVATNVLIKPYGKTKMMEFNGTSGNVALSNNALSGNLTVMGWLNLYSYGESNVGTIFSNGQIHVEVNSSGALRITRNNSTYAASANGVVSKFHNLVFFAITSNNTGVSNLYVSDVKGSPVLSGTANQAAGTPGTGSTTYLGNKSSDAATTKGLSNDIRLDESILTLAEITQYFSSTRLKYL